MTSQPGLRDRKKAQTRERLADVAAALFGEHGYDAVSVQDVAREADVSDQTVYNYFPAKHDLVLDRVDEFRERYGRVVRERPRGTSPASALSPLVEEDIVRYRHEDPLLARGEFPAQCLESAVLRRFALEAREQQADTVAAAITETDPGIAPIVARAHAAALVSVIQTMTDQIGGKIRDADTSDAAAEALRRAATAAFDDLDHHFQTITRRATS
jgi:AcrR family transcriptional regulator